MTNGLPRLDQFQNKYVTLSCKENTQNFKAQLLFIRKQMFNFITIFINNISQRYMH